MENEFSAIVDVLPGLVWTALPDGRIDYVNRTWCEYTGMSREDACGSGWAPVVHPDDVGIATVYWQTLLKSGRPGECEVRLRRHDGIYRRFLIRAVPRRNAIGRLAKWVVAGTDVEGRGQAEAASERAVRESALRQSEAFLAKTQRLSHTGTLAWRVRTDEIIWSEELYRIYEFEPCITLTHELINTRIHPEDIPVHDEMVQRQRSNIRGYESEHRLLMPDGRVKHLHLVAHVMEGENGEPEYIAAVQDITQRRFADEALDKVRAELAHVARVASLGALAASIAHEVNQPLAGIVTNASTCQRMLAADPPNFEGARETARRMIRDGNRAAEVVQRLRAMFTGKTFAVGRVDLNDAAREVIAMLLGELQQNNVIVQPEFTENLPPARGDRVQLQQVIVNLIRNASDAMQTVSDRPRRLCVGTRVDDEGDVLISVRDNGPGFDPQDAERLFHAFHTTKESGMGIGLSVSRSIIEGHGGRLWATNNEGPGACFAFTLPVWVHSAAETPVAGREAD